MCVSKSQTFQDCTSPGGGGGTTQSMNVGNDCGTSRLPFLGFHRFQNRHMYNHHSNFWLTYQNGFSPEGDKAVEFVPNIVLGNIGQGPTNRVSGRPGLPENRSGQPDTEG